MEDQEIIFLEIKSVVRNFRDYPNLILQEGDRLRVNNSV